MLGRVSFFSTYVNICWLKRQVEESTTTLLAYSVTQLNPSHNLNIRPTILSTWCGNEIRIYISSGPFDTYNIIITHLDFDWLTDNF